jgi:acyl-CoA synthetase (AMP-forming)/AMP-acid ligase II
MNIGGHLAKRAILNPRLEAFIDLATGRRVTFAELDRRVDRVAATLRGLGLCPGDRLALLLPNGAEFVELFYGAARAGIVVVPLNWRLVADELAFIIGDAGAAVLVSAPDFRAVVEDLRGREGFVVQHWLEIGTEPAPWAAGYEDLVAAAPMDPVAGIADGDDPLFIMYTSGTTGLPKGVVHTHATVQWAIFTAIATADIRFRDRYLISLPLFHVGALNPLVTSIYSGATVAIMQSFDPARIWETFRDEKITVTLAVPAMLVAMQRTYDPAVHTPLELRWIMSGAAPVPPSLIEEYARLGFEIHQVYGLTESGGPGCLISPDEALARIGSTGKPFFHTDIRLVDDDGADVGVDEPGEVLLRGEHIMVGYWNRPEDTAATIVDGWLHTGDVAVRDVEGFIYIRDRIKDMIISGGENVYPAEIEDVLLTHPSILDAAVIGMPSARWGESPLAVVVSTDPALDEKAILAHCEGKLARFKLPRRAVVTETIPRNPTGKILKRVLREQFALDAPE